MIIVGMSRLSGGGWVGWGFSILHAAIDDVAALESFRGQGTKATTLPLLVLGRSYITSDCSCHSRLFFLNFS